VKPFVVATALALAAAAASAAAPPRPITGVDVFGQPSRAAETAGRPLVRTIGVFRSAGAAARLPAPHGPMRPLAAVAAGFRGRPGALLVGETRRVPTAAGPVYLVPTARGWVCVQGPRFETCHRGLLRQAVTWSFYSTATGLDVVGVAADDVRSVTLIWGGGRRRAQLARNVFFVRRPFAATSVAHLPPLGRLAITYRDGRRPTTVELR
jgi:hypothetical protein